MKVFTKWLYCSQVIAMCLFGLALSGCIPPPSVPRGIFPKERPLVPEPNAAAVQVPAGYKAEVFMKDLIYPTSVEFDERGNMYIAEAGFAYGDLFAPARILRVSGAGEITRYAEGFMGPITDILWHQGRLYVSHLGKISTVDASGTVTDIVTDLPSSGDHQNNQMTIGPDGKIYFGQGAATNAGIVGLDNAYPFVWLMLWPDVHDVPPKDIELEGETFLTPQPNNVLARQGRLLSWWSNFTYAVASLFARDKEASMLVRTGAFQQFGESGADRIKGQVKGNSAILRMNPDGSGLEVYAWGIRNPFGVMWSPDGQLFVTNNGYDERGSRPIANAKDDILLIRQNGWYGFPDFVNGLPVTDPQFRSVRGPSPDFLLENHPPLEQPWLTRPKHAGVTKLDFSPNSLFGAAGQMYVAEVGSEAPITGEDTTKAGYIVVRIDPATKRAETFFANREPGPEGLEYVTTRGPRHPVEVKFSPDGNALYVTDIGVIHGGLAGPGPFPMPIPGSGVIWRITREGTSATPPANLSPQPPRSTPAAGR